MDVSREEQRSYVCLACQHTFPAAAWVIVDVDHRRDLAEKVASRQLRDRTCPRCGSIARAVVAYAVVRRGLRPHVMTAAPPDTDQDWFQTAAREVFDVVVEHVLPHVALTSRWMFAADESVVATVLDRDLESDGALLAAGRDEHLDDDYRALLLDVARIRGSQRLADLFERLVDTTSYEEAATILVEAGDGFAPQALRELERRLAAARDAGDEHEAEHYAHRLSLVRRSVETDPWRAVLDDAELRYDGIDDPVQMRRLAVVLDAPDTDPLRVVGAVESALSGLTPDCAPYVWADLNFRAGRALAHSVRQHDAAAARRAIHFLDEALRIWTREDYPSDWANATYFRGVVHTDGFAGDVYANYDLAIDEFRSVLEVWTADRFPGPWRATTESLANVFSRLQDPAGYVRALELYEQLAEEVDRESRPVEWGLLQGRLGFVLSRGTTAALRERARTALAEARAVLLREGRRFEAAQVTLNLGALIADALRPDDPAPFDDLLASFDEAFAYFDEVRDVFTADVHPVEFVQLHNNIAVLHRRRPERDEPDVRAVAIEEYRAALEVALSIGLLVEVSQVGTSLGLAHADAGDWQLAADAFLTAQNADREMYYASLLWTFRLDEAARRPDLCRLTAYACARAGRLEDAVVALERGLARAVNDALARDVDRIASVASADPGLYEDYRLAADAVGAADTGARLLTVERSLPERLMTRSDRRRLLQQEAEDAHVRLAAVAQRLRQFPGLEGFLAEPAFADVADAGGPGCAVVYLVPSPFGCLALLVGPSPSAPGAVVEAFWSSTGEDSLARATAPGPEPVNTMDELLEVLGRELGEPLCGRLRDIGVTALVIVPVGGFSGVPFHAVIVGPDARLHDEFPPSYSPSARTLAASRRAGAQAVARQASYLGLAYAGNDPPLRWAEAEVSAVSRMFGASAVRCDTGAALLRAAGSAGYVHLACHGRYDAERPLRSYLELADGPLYLADLLDTKAFAGVRLVIAAACHSARADALATPDEALGIATGLLAAGAAAVVGTLSAVDDLAAALLIPRLIGYHRDGDPDAGEPPMSLPRSLARAQRWLASLDVADLSEIVAASPDLVASLRAHRTAGSASYRPGDLGRPFADSRMWAPFVVIGA